MSSAAVFALADDLSGAAETAAVLMSAARPARIALSGPPYAPAPVLVADLDSRHHPRAGDVVRDALLHAAGRRVFVKIDSLLRGNVAATLAACASAPLAGADAAGGGLRGFTPVVLAPALPSAGRTVVGGVPYVGGVPLRETRAWHAEPPPTPAATIPPVPPVLPVPPVSPVLPVPVSPVPPVSPGPPASLAEVLGGLPSVLVPLGTVRGGGEALVAALAQAAGTGRVALCDAETDADLDAIVAAALLSHPGTRLVGAGGLAAALGRALSTGPAGSGSPSIGSPSTGPASTGPLGAGPSSAGLAGTRPAGVSSEDALLVVVGTAEPAAAEQARLLVRHGARAVRLDAADLAGNPDAADLAVKPDAPDLEGNAEAARRLRKALAAGPTVLTLAVESPAPPALLTGLTTALAAVVRAALDGPTPADLVLTGGETARRVLDALDVRELIPLGQIHHGAVHSRTPSGGSVVTRPGSFGERDSLLRIAAHLRPHLFPAPTAPSGVSLDERPK